MLKLEKRIHYFIAFIVLLIIELFIAIYVHDAFIRPYVGDVLVVIVLYFAVRIAIPHKCKLLPLWIFIFAAVAEGLQYLHLVQVLGLEDNTFLRIILGSTFDLKDIACYAAGSIVLGMYEWLMRRNVTVGFCADICKEEKGK